MNSIAYRRGNLLSYFSVIGKVCEHRCEGDHTFPNAPRFFISDSGEHDRLFDQYDQEFMVPGRINQEP